MAEIAYIPRSRSGAERTVLGAPPKSARAAAAHAAAPVHDEPAATAAKPKAQKKNGESLDKVVGRIPTLYVIIFAAIVTLCAVLIIWNTLQVNRLTLEKAQLDSEIEQARQRIIKLKAQEMQLSAGDRIRQIAKTKFGMVESDGINEVVVPTQ